MPAKKTYSEVVKFFQKQGHTLLTETYLGCNQTLTFKCRCGGTGTTTFAMMRAIVNRGNTSGCKECRGDRIGVSSRFTIEHAKQVYADAGCKLLEDQYVNHITPMRYICFCGREGRTSYNYFTQHGRHCKQCGFEKRTEKIKFSQEEVEAIFEAENCLLLGTYTGYHDYIDYIAQCNHKSNVTLQYFRVGGGRQCWKCSWENRGWRGPDWTFEQVRDYVASHGCVLLSTSYSGVKDQIEYRCICGFQTEIRFSNFKEGHRCKECSNRLGGDRRRHSFEFVKLFFQEAGCRLLADEYVGKDTVMPYICVCGRKSKICFASFARGSRCKDCGFVKISESQQLARRLWEEAELGDLDKILSDRLRCD
jgi:hypothetical protein